MRLRGLRQEEIRREKKMCRQSFSLYSEEKTESENIWLSDTYLLLYKGL